MVDEEAGRIGNHVLQVVQTRTQFSGGKLWFGGWGFEPFDGKRRINLFAPIAGDLPNHQFFGSWLQLPPIAGIVSRALRAQDHVEIAFGIEFQILEIRISERPGRLVCPDRSEEHTSELQSLMRISYAVFCLKKKTTNTNI